jgi:hypothetical protein
MPIDPTGTTPGLSPKTKEEEKPLLLACRNKRRKCDSMTATKLDTGPGGPRMYRCTECGHTWTINVGGAVNL